MRIFGMDTDDAGEVITVALNGEFDISCARQVEEELRQVEERKPQTLVLDLRGLSFMDSTGLRVILSADSRATKEGHRFVIVQGPEPVRRVFHITRLDERLDIVEDPAEIVEQSA
jgi:anti-sigma B factor antagonist